MYFLGRNYMVKVSFLVRRHEYVPIWIMKHPFLLKLFIAPACCNIIIVTMIFRLDI